MDLLTANDAQGHYPNSYYAATATPLPPMQDAEGDLDCDICIVGAGFTGLSSALHLADKGFDVVLLEAQRIGFGASGRNGGQVGVGQRLGQDELEDLVGPKKAKALWDISVDAVQHIKEYCERDDMDCTFHQGLIHADHRRRFVPHSLDYAKKLRDAYGYVDICGLEQDEIRERVGSNAYYGGTYDKGSGHIHPLKFALGLARIASKKGVRLFENSKVLEIADGSKPIVKTDKAQITCGQVILACNGYLGGLNRAVAQKVMPINNYIVATEPLDQAFRESLIKHNCAVADSKFVVNYFRFSDDHRLLFGGAESYGYKFPADIRKLVSKPMLDIFPQLRDTKLDYAWGGTLAITMNRMPHFAKLRSNIYSLSGYSGHGVALANYAGKIIAESLHGTSDKFDVFADLPMQNFPGGAKLRAPLLVAAMLWYSLRDRF